MSFAHYESIGRGRATRQRLAAARITICGGGAVGARLARTLAHGTDGALTVIDRRVSTGWSGPANARLRTEELTAVNVRKLLAGAHLVIDAFDGLDARAVVAAWCARRGLACLHIGRTAGGRGLALWNDRYLVGAPGPVPIGVGGDAARDPVRSMAALASEVAVRYLTRGEQASWSVSFQDGAIRRL